MSQKHHKKRPAKAKKSANAPPRTIDPLNRPVVGTWYLLDSEDKFVRSTRITLSAFGEFEFIGSAWRSKGTFKFRDGVVTLVWTSIDNQPVKPGSMKKALPVTDANRRLQLDRFRYGKAS